MKWERGEQIVISYVVHSISFVRQFVVCFFFFKFVLKKLLLKYFLTLAEHLC